MRCSLCPAPPTQASPSLPLHHYHYHHHHHFITTTTAALTTATALRLLQVREHAKEKAADRSAKRNKQAADASPGTAARDCHLHRACTPPHRHHYHPAHSPALPPGTLPGTTTRHTPH
jgi:hypothetical protein